MPGIFRFDDFVLDGDAFELRRGDELVPVEPRVLDLLMVLAARPDVVLTRDALVASVWKGRVVSDSTVATAIKWARKALGDSGRDQRYIRTVRGRGIRFVVSPETGRAKVLGAEHTRSEAARPLTLYVRPSDATDDRPPTPLTRALRARLVSVLSRVPLLSVATPFPEADRPMDPRELRSRFDVAHVLDVCVQEAGAALVADVALIDTRAGLQAWARRFEVPAGPGDREALLRSTIRRVEPRLVQAMVTEMEARGGGGDPESSLLRAIALLSLGGWHRTSFLEAARLIERSIDIAPDLALAHAHLALVKALGHRVGLLRDEERLIPLVISAAETALALDDRDSTVLGLAGCALADVGQVDRALPILRRAIDADPRNGHARTAFGAALMMRGDYEGAARHLAEGMACSPADSRLSIWGTALALAQLALGELDGALDSASDACGEDDRIYLPRLALAGVHLARKERPQAVSAVRESLRTKPDLNREEIVCILGERLGEDVWSIVRSLDGSCTPASDA